MVLLSSEFGSVTYCDSNLSEDFSPGLFPITEVSIWLSKVKSSDVLIVSSEFSNTLINFCVVSTYLLFSFSVSTLSWNYHESPESATEVFFMMFVSSSGVFSIFAGFRTVWGRLKVDRRKFCLGASFLSSLSVSAKRSKLLVLTYICPVFFLF